MGDRIFILGSCVSRDAFEAAGAGLVLAGYLARTSLASAFGEQAAPEPLRRQARGLQSSFQRRMVATDLGKEAGQILRAGGFDHLLLDLIDERFPLVRIGGSDRSPTLVTLSAELASLCRPGGRRVDPGTPLHWAQWCKGVGRLLEHVPPERIVLNPARWATRSTRGELLQGQDEIRKANGILDRMYDHLMGRLGIRAITYAGGFLADPDHKWGLAPFHYPTEIYIEAMAQLRSLVGIEQVHEEAS